MNSKLILVADDEPNIQRMVRVCLESEGYRVESVSNGRQALDFISREAPDLLLLDLAMPVLDGMSVLVELHERQRAPGSRIVVMTAHGSVRNAVQAIRLGASDFLEKPFAPEDLRLSIASVLDSTRTGLLEPGATYEDVLTAVRESLKSGKLAEAESLLMTAGTITDADPAFLNLAGIVHEAHGRPHSAIRFYQKSLRTNPTYEPAQNNLNRLNRLHDTSSTNRHVDFGEPAVALQDNR
jgi:DNA-binding response OmpR family regulator